MSKDCVYVGGQLPNNEPHVFDLTNRMLTDFQKVIELAEENPNDQELGEKLREFLQPYIIIRHTVQKQIQNG